MVTGEFCFCWGDIAKWMLMEGGGAEAWIT